MVYSALVHANQRHIALHLISRAIARGAKPLVIPQLFQTACTALGVDLVVHEEQTLDLAHLPELGPNDMIYRSASGAKAQRVERMMTTPTTASFRKNWTSVFDDRGCSYYLHEKIGIPVIPSVPFIPDTDEGIESAVAQLGNFPLIVKILGGSHGVGVVRIDSMPSLKSLLDYLRAARIRVLLRKYIPHKYYARLVVVGDDVVASHIAFAMEAEFRTNAGDDTHQKREARVFSPEIRAMAVRAVHALGLETGGVDLLFDVNDQPHLAEVNFPNDFSVTQRVTGIDIAEAMVKHLLAKTQA